LCHWRRGHAWTKPPCRRDRSPRARHLGDREFPASPAGYGALVEWLRGYGELDRVGVEGTGTYGAGLTRHLREAGMLIVEVDRPDRWARRAHGKSDPRDANSAARAALSGAASVVPKLRRRPGRGGPGPSRGTIQCRQSRKSGHESNQIVDRHRSGAAARAAAPAHLEDDCGLRPTPPRTPTWRHRTRHQDGAAPAGPSPSTAFGGDHRSRPRASSTGAAGRPSCLPFPGLDPRSPARCSSAPATTLTGGMTIPTGARPRANRAGRQTRTLLTALAAEQPQ
jgi:hypothetical protein